MSVPIDVLLLLALVPAYVWGFRQEMILIVFALAAYLAVAMWQPLTDYNELPQSGKAKWSFLLRWMLVLVIITAVVIVPSFKNMLTLWTAELDADGYTSAYLQYHDGAIQIAEAVEFLADGKNPYVETYENTPVQFFGFQAEGEMIRANPGLDYLAYLPGYLWLSWPAYVLANAIGFPYDQRWVYLLLYAVLILSLPHLTKNPADKLVLTIAVGLNPLFVRPIIIGMNDVAVLLGVIGAVLALQRKHWLLSAILFGLACALKQFAWFIAPFYLLWVSWKGTSRKDGKLDIKLGVKTAVIIAAVMLIIIGPFALWDMNAFIEDVFLYPSGRVGVNYPIIGYTVGTLLIGLGVIPSHYADFPFTILQIVLGIPLLFVLLRHQWQDNGVGEMFLSSGLFILGFGLVSRFFQDNYVGFVAILITLGLMLRQNNESISSIPNEI